MCAGGGAGHTIALRDSIYSTLKEWGGEGLGGVYLVLKYGYSGPSEVY